MHSVTQAILFDYFDGKSSPLQRQLIEEWIKEADNAEIFYQCLEQWELRKLQFVPDVDEVHMHYLQRLQTENNPGSTSLSKLDQPPKTLAQNGAGW